MDIIIGNKYVVNGVAGGKIAFEKDTATAEQMAGVRIAKVAELGIFYHINNTLQVFGYNLQEHNL